MATEIELKLAIEPKVARRLHRLPPLRAGARGGATSGRLRTVYYDTPDHALEAAGVSVRLREGPNGWVQTVKAAPRATGALSERTEIEIQLAGPELDLESLLAGPVGALLQDSQGLARLEPIFETDFKRTRRALALGGDSACELCIDRGSIRAHAEHSPASAETPISELELELTGGKPADLVRFARKLARRVEVRLEPRSKAARGYALAKGAGPGPTRFTPPGLDRDMDAATALTSIAGAAMNQLLANALSTDRIDDSDPRNGALPEPGFIHQARIAMRRIRLALGLLDGLADDPRIARTRRDLRRLARRLAPARDLDVVSAGFADEIERAFDGDRQIARFLERLRRDRGDAYRGARDAFASKRFTKTLLRLTAILVELRSARPREVGAFATHTLERGHARCLRAGASFDTLDVDRLHTLRKRIKAQRYTGECFATLWSVDRTAVYLARLEALQDALGMINDAATLSAHAAGVTKQTSRPRRGKAAALIEGYARAIARAHGPEAAARWREFESAPVFWR
jgi:inorganic triphosphatase YgiF